MSKLPSKKLYGQIKSSWRRAKKYGVESSLTGGQWRKICKAWHDRCAKCFTHGKLTIDHIKPMCAGGPNVHTNIQPLCESCNKNKHSLEILYIRGLWW